MPELKVLVVEDDAALREAYVSVLRRAGYEAHPAGDAATALRVFRAVQPDLVVLDLYLGEGPTGMALISAIRALDSACALLMISAYGGDGRINTALDLGADNYLTKPVSPEQFIRRVQAELKRTRRSALAPVLSGRFAYGDLVVDLGGAALRHTASGRARRLSALELKALRTLLLRPQQYVPFRQLVEACHGAWGPHTEASCHQLVHRLRAKLRVVAPEHADLITTDAGLGYYIRTPDQVNDRVTAAAPVRHSDGRLTLSLSEWRIWGADETRAVRLTRQEAGLLNALVESLGQVVPVDELRQALGLASTTAVHKLAFDVRAKLELAAPGSRDRLVTRRGQGLCLDWPAARVLDGGDA